MRRLSDLDAFYNLLTQLEDRIGGCRRLGDCHGRMDWSERGVYFFFEPNQNRASGDEQRVVRVGTHALTTKSRTTLWNRLSQHRGTTNPYGSNHRGSIFRLLSGEAMILSNPDLALDTWGKGSTASREIRLNERQHEARVSDYLGSMTLLYVSVPDASSPDSLRGVIERNSIALLSNYVEATSDQASDDWLGCHSGRERVRRSGLWNNNHVDESYDSDFLNVFEDMIKQT